MGQVEAFSKELIGAGKIAIYGTNSCGKLAKQAIEIFGGEVSIYIDRLRNKKYFENVPVLHYDEIKDIDQYYIINCAAANFWNISEFLFNEGIDIVYHAIPLLKMLPENDKALEMLDTRKLYEHYVKKEKSTDIYKLSLVITEKCSLSCKYCTEYMPYIRNSAKHTDINLCKKSVVKLLDVIGKIESLTILGGELFTHPNWYDLVEWCVEESRIYKIVLLTNSTIIPSKWEILRNKKVLLALDNYGKVSYKLDELISWAEKEEINYTVFQHEHWFDVSEYKYIQETERELIKKYEVCGIKGCWNISDGFLYKCTTSYYKMKYMLSREIGKETDFIDLLAMDKNEIKKAIDELSNKNYIEACKYCIGTTNDNMIKVAEQIYE